MTRDELVTVIYGLLLVACSSIVMVVAFALIVR
jgi:hypothetical protein